MALSAIGTHLSIGSIYAYSAWKMPLENTFGWSATKTAMAFSIAICTLGLSAAFLGKLIEKKGPRFGCILATLFFCTGLAGSALACKLEHLLLFYLCFGVISGVGLGLGYISPVSTLVKWFPKQRGLATGLAIMGFGFGGMVCTQLIDVFAPADAEVEIPVSMSAFEYTTAVQSGEPAAIDASGEATYSVLIYNKNSIVRAFLSLAGIYFCIMLPSALYIAPPQPGSVPVVSALQNSPSSAASMKDVSPAEAIRSPAFYGLWLMLFLNATCGIALIATAKKMGYEMVHLSAAMASGMVMGISLFNGLGRIFWSSLSDWLGATQYLYRLLRDRDHCISLACSIGFRSMVVPVADIFHSLLLRWRILHHAGLYHRPVRDALDGGNSRMDPHGMVYGRHRWSHAQCRDLRRHSQLSAQPVYLHGFTRAGIVGVGVDEAWHSPESFMSETFERKKNDPKSGGMWGRSDGLIGQKTQGF